MQIYSDDVRQGAVSEGVDTDGPYSSPAPDAITYLRSAEGCPEQPPPWTGEQPAS
ncbi:hypothetical protein [uncultured Modestobacter sp.]|uniref:hypothetical protein n=1 Tax=uncultured Modestobacter sp. TaxID=380048 RepID=UPI00260B2368|nr:hypothetical protein [uncultured Modestobacter sp.]